MKKRKRRSEVRRAPKVDDNADYGLYYTAAGASTKNKSPKHFLKSYFFDTLYFQVLGLMKEPWR